MSRRLLRIFAIFLFPVFCATVSAQPQGPGMAHIPLPAELSGTLNGSAYQIRVPANWNGTLLVFAHGTQLQPGAAEIGRDLLSQLVTQTETPIACAGRRS